MPKRSSPKQSDYLQFRPYRAFTATSGKGTENRSWPMWLFIILLALVAVSVVGAFLFTR